MTTDREIIPEILKIMKAATAGEKHVLMCPFCMLDGATPTLWLFELTMTFECVCCGMAGDARDLLDWIREND